MGFTTQGNPTSSAALFNRELCVIAIVRGIGIRDCTAVSATADLSITCDNIRVAGIAKL
jgi:hypothetical protein